MINKYLVQIVSNLLKFTDIYFSHLKTWPEEYIKNYKIILITHFDVPGNHSC